MEKVAIAVVGHSYAVWGSLCQPGEGEPETPEHRFNRLQTEVKLLLEDLDKATAVVPAADDGVSPAVLASEVQFLQQQLQQVKLSNMLGPNAGAIKASSGLQDELSQ